MNAYKPSIKYVDSAGAPRTTNYILITLTDKNNVYRASEYSIPFRYAEFWGVKNKEGTQINSTDVLYGYKLGDSYFLKRAIPPGQSVPFQIENDNLKRDLSEFYFKAQTDGDGVLIIYWY